MTMQPGGKAPAGFYPAENGRVRYWDGDQWTTLYQDDQPSVETPGAGPTARAGTAAGDGRKPSPHGGGAAANTSTPNLQPGPRPYAAGATVEPQDLPAAGGLPTMVLGAPTTSPVPDQRTWFARHKILTGVLSVVLLLFVLGIISVASGSSGTKVQPVAGPTSSQASAPTSSPATTSAADKAAADKAAADKAAADKAAADKAAADKAAADKAAADKAAADKAAADKAAADQAAAGTVGQQNAVKKAESYLQFTAFSRSGLIHQLGFEGFSTEDATYAVDKLNVDWNAQAANKAKDYLKFTSFSHSSLVQQLKFEGFTAEQAEYGASQTGL